VTEAEETRFWHIQDRIENIQQVIVTAHCDTFMSAGKKSNFKTLPPAYFTAQDALIKSTQISHFLFVDESYVMQLANPESCSQTISLQYCKTAVEFQARYLL
jgi:hypothetical protein